MWRAFDETGRLQYPDFVETVMQLMPMYWVRVVGGTLYLVGMVLFGYNILMTWQTRPATYEVPVIQAAPLTPGYVEDAPRADAGARRPRRGSRGALWHRTLGADAAHLHRADGAWRWSWPRSSRSSRRS